MKIQLNGEDIYCLSDEDILLLKDEIPSSNLTEDIKSRLIWVIEHKCEQRLKQFKDRWTPILLSDKLTIPKDKKDFIAMVVARSDYLDREGMDAEFLAKANAQAQVQ